MGDCLFLSAFPPFSGVLESFSAPWIVSFGFWDRLFVFGIVSPLSGIISATLVHWTPPVGCLLSQVRFGVPGKPYTVKRPLPARYSSTAT